MQIVIYSLLIVLILGLSAFLYLHIRRQYKTQGLSLADKTNIVMTVVNIVLLVLAVLSIHIALKSYQAAQESGTQQQRTLDASKIALSSLVGVLKAQQGTLDDSRRALKESGRYNNRAEKALAAKCRDLTKSACCSGCPVETGTRTARSSCSADLSC